MSPATKHLLTNAEIRNDFDRAANLLLKLKEGKDPVGEEIRMIDKLEQIVERLKVQF